MNVDVDASRAHRCRRTAEYGESRHLLLARTGGLYRLSGPQRRLSYRFESTHNQPDRIIHCQKPQVTASAAVILINHQPDMTLGVESCCDCFAF